MSTQCSPTPRSPRGSSVQPWLWDGWAISWEAGSDRMITGSSLDMKGHWPLNWGEASAIPMRLLNLKLDTTLLTVAFVTDQSTSSKSKHWFSVCKALASPQQCSAQPSNMTVVSWSLQQLYPHQTCNCNWKRKFLPFFQQEQRVTGTLAQYLGRFYHSFRFAELAVDLVCSLPGLWLTTGCFPRRSGSPCPFPKRPRRHLHTRLQVSWGLLGEVAVCLTNWWIWWQLG